MTPRPTTLASPAIAAGHLPTDFASEWRAFVQFIRKPRLPAANHPQKRFALVGTLRMVLIDYGLMFTLMLVASAVVVTGWEMPESNFGDLPIDAAFVALAVLVAPISEEFIFRGWLTARPAMVWAVGALLVGAGLAMIVPGTGLADGYGSVLIGGIVIGTILVALGLLFALRNRATYAWPPGLFTCLFWASTLAFALVHMVNYEQGAALALVPLVLPQFIGGAVFGYVRVHYGLWASILAHALHNGAVLALVASASAREMAPA